jgi:hypothetical protein
MLQPTGNNTDQEEKKRNSNGPTHAGAQTTSVVKRAGRIGDSASLARASIVIPGALIFSFPGSDPIWNWLVLEIDPDPGGLTDDRPLQFVITGDSARLILGICTE